MSKNKNAIITLGLQLDRFGNPTPELEQRVDKAVRLFKGNLAPILIMSGAYCFSAKDRPAKTEAAVMAEIAMQRDVPPEAILVESQAVDTISNALQVKEIIKNGFGHWRDLALVTSGSHMPRALFIFKHVMGPDYDITPEASDEVTVPSNYEALALRTAQTIFEDVAPGDDMTIRTRLANVIPGFGIQPGPYVLPAAA